MAILTDGSITLRPPELRDAAAVADNVRASLAEVAPWMPWATASYDVADAEAWIQLPGEHPFVIVDGAGTIVGTCGLNAVDDANRRANLGYWVRTDRTGEGLATKATRLLAVHGIETLALQRLEIVMSVHNEPSRRVAERSGATYEGVLRSRLMLHGVAHDAHSYSIVAADLADTSGVLGGET